MAGLHAMVNHFVASPMMICLRGPIRLMQLQDVSRNIVPPSMFFHTSFFKNVVPQCPYIFWHMISLHVPVEPLSVLVEGRLDICTPLSEERAEINTHDSSSTIAGAARQGETDI